MTRAKRVLCSISVTMSSEDSEPLVQFQDYDSDDDNMDEFDPYEGIERTSNKSGRSFGKTHASSFSSYLPL